MKVVWNAESVNAFGKHDINLGNIFSYLPRSHHAIYVNTVVLELVDCVGSVTITVVGIYKIYAYCIINHISTYINPVNILTTDWAWMYGTSVENVLN